MNGLYPIVRRVRRPLVRETGPEGEGFTVPVHVKAGPPLVRVEEGLEEAVARAAGASAGATRAPDREDGPQAKGAEGPGVPAGQAGLALADEPEAAEREEPGAVGKGKRRKGGGA